MIRYGELATLFAVPAVVALRGFGCALQNNPGAEAMPIAGMETEVPDQYAAIVGDDRFYVPFCPSGIYACGRQTGIADGDDQEKVFGFKGHSVNEWIVKAHSAHDGAMLYREQNVQHIPGGLVSEYGWNNVSA